MQVTLKDLQVNPFRDLTVDPIDDAAVEVIKKSIEEDGFWGGIVLRRHNGAFQIAAGHHRVKAAIAAGIKTADLFVGDIDDHGMIRIYARENASQRGNGSTAVAGTVASAIRYLAKQICVGNFTHASVKSNTPSAADIGWKIVLDCLQGTPGVNEMTIKAQLANLKASGDYARIVGEVQAEVDAEIAAEQERIRKQVAKEEQARKEAEARAKREAEESERLAELSRKAAEKAKRDADEAAQRRANAEMKAAEARAAEALKRQSEEAKIAIERKAKLDAEAEKFDLMRTKAKAAADKASEREITFDFEGVAKYLKNENQVRVFREVATSPGIQPYLPVANQAEIAKWLAEESAKRGVELSGVFIKNTISDALFSVKSKQKKSFREEEKRQLELRDIVEKMKDAQKTFARDVNRIWRTANEISDLAKDWPKKEVPMPMSGEFKTAMEDMVDAARRLRAAGLI